MITLSRLENDSTDLGPDSEASEAEWENVPIGGGKTVRVVWSDYKGPGPGPGCKFKPEMLKLVKKFDVFGDS